MAAVSRQCFIEAMPFYRFYLHGESPTPSDGAGFGDDGAALLYAYRFLEPGGNVSVWDGGRHVAELWGQRRAGASPHVWPQSDIRVDWARISPPARRRR